MRRFNIILGTLVVHYSRVSVVRIITEERLTS